MPILSEFKFSRPTLIDLSCVLIIVMAIGMVNYYYLSANKLDNIGDEAAHLVMASDFFRHPAKFFGNERAPIPFLHTATFFFAFGISKVAAVMSNLYWVFILLISAYGIGLKLYNRKVALFSVLVLLCFPMTLGMSRMYMTENALAAMTSLSIFLLLSTDGFSNRTFSVMLGISCGLGVLSRISFPVYLIGPGVVVLVQSRQQFINNKKCLHNLLLAFFCAMIICMLWLTPARMYDRFLSIMDVPENPANNIGMGYGAGLVLYLYSMVDFSLSYIGYLLFPAYISMVRTKQRHLLFLSIMLIAPILIFNVFSWKLARYIYPNLVAAALIIAIWLKSIKNPIFLKFVVTCLIGWLILLTGAIYLPVGEKVYVRGLIETQWHRSIVGPFGLTPNLYREDFWIQPPSNKSFRFSTVVNLMNQVNMKFKDVDRIGRCYLLLNSRLRGDKIWKGEFIEHPFSWPIETYFALNSLEYSFRPIWLKDNRIHMWHPDLSDDAIDLKAPCFILMFDTVHRHFLETNFILKNHGKVSSFYGTVHIYSYHRDES